MARVLLGVTGGIAAYKALELTRLATKAGHAVRVIQTEASTRFVGTASFAAITGAPVLITEWEADALRGAFPGDPAPEHAPLSHLALVERCDLYVIAPASANTIAKLAAGQADNLLTAAALACRRPLIVAPAMNDAMYEHAATRANLDTLRARGVEVLEPGTGALGSPGEWGVGRLPEPADLLAAIEARLGATAGGQLDGAHVLVTAGGTREPIDAVRFVGNRSSGKMGWALAEEAARRGARVTVVAANVSLPRRPGIDYVDVSTAAELAAACEERFPSRRRAADGRRRRRLPARRSARRQDQEGRGGGDAEPRARAHRGRPVRPRRPTAAPTSCWSASPPSTATRPSPTRATSCGARASTPSSSTTSRLRGSRSTRPTTRSRSSPRTVRSTSRGPPRQPSRRAFSTPC